MPTKKQKEAAYDKSKCPVHHLPVCAKCRWLPTGNWNEKAKGAGKCLSVEQVRQAIDDLPTYMETNNITFQYVDGNIKLVEVGKFRGLFISKTDLKRKLGVG